MIVIDVGCAKYGGDYSIERLIEEFAPDMLWGFDPNWQADMYVSPEGATTSVIVSNEAAWTYDGQIGFTEVGLGSIVTERSEEPRVPCIDLARFILELPERVALKIDAEGAEYEILEHLIATGANERLELIWVEWHPLGAKVNSRPDERREAIESKIGCELHQWNW